MSQASGSGASVPAGSLPGEDGNQAYPEAHNDDVEESGAARFFEPELVRHLMEKSEDIVSSDRHAIVLRSWEGDTEVAVMYWNPAWRYPDRGLDMLSNEAKVYEEVAEKHPHLLGTALPRLVALLPEPRVNIVVVIQVMGEPVTTPRDSSATGRRLLRLGNTNLDYDDCKLLERAAFKALDEIHSTGLRHKHIGQRSIRAKREVDEDGTVRWTVWFYNFEYARFSGDEDEAIEDEYALLRVFGANNPA